MTDSNTTGTGRGRNNGNNAGSGPGGRCVCSKCGASVAHSTGTPCYSRKCSKCGGKMLKK